MRYFIICLCAGLLLGFGCIKKNTAPANGVFISNAHTTSGNAFISTASDGKKSLVFETFKTDSGPDLRVWLSTNTSGSSYVELGNLKAVSGSFSYELAADVNLSTHNHVLIWCKQFSVLFGHAVLK